MVPPLPRRRVRETSEDAEVVAADKPNPFQVLQLPTDATNEDIVTRGQELSELAETEDERLLYRWAIEQLITRKQTRLEYELFEMPAAEYDDPDWDRFERAHRRRPVDLAELARQSTPPDLQDFDLATLLRLILRGLLVLPQPDLAAAFESSPVAFGAGPPPLEVRDVIFS